jgi:chemotaxis protein CheC
MAEQLKTDVGFSAPSMAADRVSPAIVVRGEEMRAACALFMEVNFHLERRSFACHLIMLMPEEEIAAIGDAVDRFMENY